MVGKNRFLTDYASILQNRHFVGGGVREVNLPTPREVIHKRVYRFI